jgi:hypothetical protein
MRNVEKPFAPKLEKPIHFRVFQVGISVGFDGCG